MYLELHAIENCLYETYFCLVWFLPIQVNTKNTLLNTWTTYFNVVVWISSDLIALAYWKSDMPGTWKVKHVSYLKVSSLF